MFYRNVIEISVDKDLLDEIRAACPDSEIKEKGEKTLIIDDRKKRSDGYLRADFSG